MRRRLAVATTMLSLLLALPLPAMAAGTLDQEQSSVSNVSSPTVNCLAQTFMAGRSGDLDMVSLFLVKSFFSSSDLRVELRAAGSSGPGSTVLAGATVAYDDVATFDGEWVDVTFGTVAAVEAGLLYAIVIRDLAPDQFEAFAWLGDTGDPYPAGAAYVQGDCGGAAWSPEPGADFAFRTYVAAGGTEDGDEDGDGVTDSADRCAGTVLPDTFARYHPSRYAAQADGTLRSGQSGSPVYTVQQTGGCSAIQVIEAMGLGGGHADRGLPRGELEAWIESLAQ